MSNWACRPFPGGNKGGRFTEFKKSIPGDLDGENPSLPRDILLKQPERLVLPGTAAPPGKGGVVLDQL
mgnify:CR=1 FL=1